MKQTSLETKPILNRLNAQKRNKRNGITMAKYNQIAVFLTLLAVVTAHYWEKPQNNTTHKFEIRNVYNSSHQYFKQGQYEFCGKMG